MALTNTTAAAAIGANDTTIKVTSATGFAAGQLIRIDNELMVQAASSSTTVLPVRRGLEGSAQVAHGILADVVTGLASDFPPSPPGGTTFVAADPQRISLGVDTTFVAGDMTGDTTYVITKATAAAITLGAPTKAQNGLKVTFRSATAAAHVITYSAGLYGDTTASDTATFAAKVGASCTFEANGGTWGVIALANVTVA